MRRVFVISTIIALGGLYLYRRKVGRRCCSCGRLLGRDYLLKEVIDGVYYFLCMNCMDVQE
jgi:predicted  nucleic acid-binding Zn ribbon protein